MKHFLEAFGSGVLTGGFLCYVFASKIVSQYHKAANEAGLMFRTWQGKVQLIKKVF